MQEMRFFVFFFSFSSFSFRPLSIPPFFPFFMLLGSTPEREEQHWAEGEAGLPWSLTKTTAYPRGALRLGVGGSSEVVPVLAFRLCVNQSLHVGALGTEV